MGLFFVILLMLISILAITNFFKVPHATEYVIERLGQYKKICKAGPHFKMPFIDTIRSKVDMREIVCDFEPQPAITSDNVTIDIDAVVYMKVFDSVRYTYGVNDPMGALENLTATTLRNIIGSKLLDQTLTSRDDINQRMRAALGEAAANWGMNIQRVEVKNITPPPEVKEAMEVEMRAERERRSAITRAEGEKKAAILRAEGEKAAAVLNSEAIKIQMIAEAEAEASKIEKLLNSGLNKEEIIRLRGLTSLERAADGQSTKIIVPSDISNLSGLVTSLKEAADTAPAVKTVPVESISAETDPMEVPMSDSTYPEESRRSAGPEPTPVHLNRPRHTDDSSSSRRPFSDRYNRRH